MTSHHRANRQGPKRGHAIMAEMHIADWVISSSLTHPFSRVPPSTAIYLGLHALLVGKHWLGSFAEANICICIWASWQKLLDSARQCWEAVHMQGRHAFSTAVLALFDRSNRPHSHLVIFPLFNLLFRKGQMPEHKLILTLLQIPRHSSIF